MTKDRKFNEYITIRLNQELKHAALQKGIRPEHFRRFIEEYGSQGHQTKIKSDEWKRLRDIIVKSPSLNLIGDIGSGKTHLSKLLISNDKNHRYIVLDAHNEYDELPVVNTITPELTQNSRIRLPDQPEGAIGMFRVYYNLIMNNQFPAHFVLIVDEALRYKDSGIKNLIAESRKFLKVLAISQEQLVDFCPNLHVENYNQINI